MEFNFLHHINNMSAVLTWLNYTYNMVIYKLDGQKAVCYYTATSALPTKLYEQVYPATNELCILTQLTVSVYFGPLL